MLVTAVACSGAGEQPVTSTTTTTTTTTSTTSTTTTTTTTTVPSLDTGDLADPAVITIEVDGVEMQVALADTPATRARGLMEVEDLGDLAGMLFDLGGERVASFHMLNTLIPLDVVFFDAAGTGRTMLTMQPCPGEPCPTYSSEVAVRYALEVPAGTTDVTADSVLVFP